MQVVIGSKTSFNFIVLLFALNLYQVPTWYKFIANAPESNIELL